MSLDAFPKFRELLKAEKKTKVKPSAAGSVIIGTVTKDQHRYLRLWLYLSADLGEIDVTPPTDGWLLDIRDPSAIDLDQIRAAIYNADPTKPGGPPPWG